MNDIEGAVIACAGFGSRLGMGMPKCMIEVGGKSILSRLIETLQPLIENIYIVVGYRGDLITEYCSKYYPEVIIVENPDFSHTNTAHSIRLGAAGMENKVLFLDGDLVIEPSSLRDFIQLANKFPLLIGVTPAKSSQAVFVTLDEVDKESPPRISAFHRELATAWEWANVFAGSPSLLKEGAGYVYECIEPFLPAPSFLINLCEVDTPEDLHMAKEWILVNSLEEA